MTSPPKPSPREGCLDSRVNVNDNNKTDNMMNNKVLILLAKAVGTVVLFFIGHLILQYLDKGIVDFTDSLRFALIFGLGVFVGREIVDYFRRKKNTN